MHKLRFLLNSGVPTRSLLGVLLLLATGSCWSAIYPLPAGSSYLALGDFNGDGKPDVVVIRDGGGIVLLLNVGDGTFGNAQTFQLPILPNNVIAADFNGDSKLDLAIGGYDPSNRNRMIEIVLGNGNGTFQLLAPFRTDCASFFPMAAQDFNQDEKQDVMCWDQSFLGLGDGTFSIEMAAGPRSFTMAIADFNGDGNLDLLTGQGRIYLRLGNGDGTFQPPQHPRGVAGGVATLATADFNRDGKADGVFASFVKKTNQTFVVVTLGNGDGTFHRTARMAADWSGYPSNRLLVADYNGDGLPDAILLPDIFLSLGKGKLAPPFRAPFVALGGTFGLGAIDLNGDGKADLLAVEQAGFGEQLEVVLAP